MTATLFRLEVLEAARAQAMGTVLLARRPVDSALVLVVAACAAALLAAAVWAPLPRRATVQGVVAAGEGSVAVSAGLAGTVEALLFEEGQWVQAGQALARLAPTAGGTALHTRLQRQRALEQRAELLRQEVLLLKERHGIRRHQLEAQAAHVRQVLEQTLEEQRLQDTRLQSAAEALERQQRLLEAGFVAPAQLEAAKAPWLEARLRQAAHQREGAARRQEQYDLERQLANLDREHGQQHAQLARQRLELEQMALEARETLSHTIAAPRAGRVSAPHLREGAVLAAGQPLLELWPSGEPQASRWQAVLWVPSRAVGALRPGQDVRIRLSAFPHRLHGAPQGFIRSVATSPALPGALDGLSPQSGEAYYRVVVDLGEPVRDHAGRALPLKSGMRLDADITLDRTPLWQWLFEPLLAHRQAPPIFRASGPGER